MPVETASVPAEQKKDPSQAPKTFTFQKTKFVILSVAMLLLFLAALAGSYFLGQDSVGKDVVVKKEDSNKEEKVEDLIEAGLGEEVEAKNGIAIELQEAGHDQAYEKSKEETKKYYEKNASQSAYLDSEYLKQSSLVLKISVKNTSDKVAVYSPSSSKDNQYTSGFGYEGDAPKVTTSNLNPSETTRLSVSYIVPTAEKNFKLIYENVVIEFSL
jgi:hypothetical protein